MSDPVRDVHEDGEVLRFEIPIPDDVLEEREIDDMVEQLMPRIEEAVTRRLEELFDE
jgi:hypothetical protein